MSAQGVLAVMDECRELVATTLADPEGAETIGEARATVAELIEARERDREVFDKAMSALDLAAGREHSKIRRSQYRTAAEMCGDRIRALDAALARAGGEKC